MKLKVKVKVEKILCPCLFWSKFSLLFVNTSYIACALRQSILDLSPFRFPSHSSTYYHFSNYSFCSYCLLLFHCFSQYKNTFPARGGFRIFQMSNVSNLFLSEAEVDNSQCRRLSSLAPSYLTFSFITPTKQIFFTISLPLSYYLFISFSKFLTVPNLIPLLKSQLKRNSNKLKKKWPA